MIVRVAQVTGTQLRKLQAQAKRSREASDIDAAKLRAAIKQAAAQRGGTWVAAQLDVSRQRIDTIKRRP